MASRSSGRSGGCERGGQQPAHHDPRSLGVGVRQEDCELVAADPEAAVRAPDAGRHQALPKVARARSPAAWPLLSLIGLNSSRSTIASESGTLVALRRLDLAIELLLEGAVVAEAGERVAQRVGQGGLVGDVELRARPRPAGRSPRRQQDVPPVRQAASERQPRRGSRSLRGTAPETAWVASMPAAAAHRQGRARSAPRARAHGSPWVGAAWTGPTERSRPCASSQHAP